MNILPKGIIPALLSGFHADESFSPDATYALAKRLAETGVGGLYVGGSTGEMLQMSISERMELTETAIAAVRDSGRDCAVIVQVGGIAHDAPAIAKHAEKAGAAAISSLTPLYYKFRFDEIEAYYRTLGESVNIPLVMYNIPVLSGVSFDFTQLEVLMTPSYVGGIKFTASDFFTFERVRQRFPDKVMYSGFDEMFLSGLAMGADGAVGTTYNFMAEVFMTMQERYLSGDHAGALALQHRANAVIADLLKIGVMPGTKAIVTYKGIDIGNCRSPFAPLTREARAFAVDSYKRNIEG